MPYYDGVFVIPHDYLIIRDIDFWKRPQK